MDGITLMSFAPDNRQTIRKKFTTLCAVAVFAAAALVLSACSNDSEVSLNAEAGEAAIHGYDPVSYFTAANPRKGSEEYTHVVNGRVYQFASRENLELFTGNPGRYAPQYDGYCAFALSRGNYIGINPEAYAIIDDKLYLTYDFNIRNAWLQDKENYISMADKNWLNSKYNNQ